MGVTGFYDLDYRSKDEVIIDNNDNKVYLYNIFISIYKVLYNKHRNSNIQ